MTQAPVPFGGSARRRPTAGSQTLEAGPGAFVYVRNQGKALSVQGLDEETALGEAVQRGRGVAFVDLSPGGLGQAMDVSADVKVRAERVEQGSVIVVGALLGT